MPKSYDKEPIEVYNGGSQNGDLMIIQGILGFRVVPRAKSMFLAIEDCDISNTNLPTKSRIDYWVKNSLAIKNSENVRFIKLHTHGAWEGCTKGLLGEAADEMYSYLEKNYNDGKKYRLH